MPARRSDPRGPLALLLLAFALVRARASTLPFCADDFLFLDLVRKHPGLAAFAAPDPIGNFFRPLSRAGWFALLAPLSFESSVVFHVANLLLFLAAVALFVRLARAQLAAAAVSPEVAFGGALAGAAFLALHYAFDVPVMWASGSQDLLATLFALLALVLAQEGRAWPGGAALLVALLCKESVAPLAAIAVVLARAAGDSWRGALRRAAPLFVATALWAALWTLARTRGAMRASPLSFAWSDPLAALAHAGQTALALEFPVSGGPRLAPLAVLAAALAAIAVAVALVHRPAAGAKGRPRAARGSMRPVVAGLAWAALAAAPVALVAPIWSAYFYGFALFGVALALAGALVKVAPARRAAVAGATVFALGVLSAQASALDEFAPAGNAWAFQSHVNRHYFDRAMTLIASMVQDLRAAHPALPQRSTLYFANVPSYTGFQVADGPLVRWAYRDPTLKSHYLADFDSSAARGPVYVLAYDGRRLVDATGKGMFEAMAVGLAQFDKLEAARQAFRLSIEREPESANVSRQWLEWIDRALAPVDSARAPDPDVRAAVATARAALARADTSAAFGALLAVAGRATHDPEPHAMLADLSMRVPRLQGYAVFQAFIVRTLAPTAPASWRRWAVLLAVDQRDRPVIAAIERWRALSPPGARDPELDAIEAAARARQPGGAVARESLKRVETP